MLQSLVSRWPRQMYLLTMARSPPNEYSCAAAVPTNDPITNTRTRVAITIFESMASFDFLLLDFIMSIVLNPGMGPKVSIVRPLFLLTRIMHEI